MGWEMHAYDCMGVDYFYLGDMEKCNYYHDRIVRGKFESEDSVLKSVTMSTIRSKREGGIFLELPCWPVQTDALEFTHNVLRPVEQATNPVPCLSSYTHAGT